MRLSSPLSCLVLLAAAAAADDVLDPVVVRASRVQSAPPARSLGRVERGTLEATDAFSLKDLLDKTPGVFAKQSNGPRDVSISVRGSGAKTSFAIRNIKMFEDWFPVTQSDGLSRTDVHDPNAYEGLDVVRGPSSAMHGNYALGGAVNFRTRRGADVDGLETGATAGSYGYQNERLHLGGRTRSLDWSAFASHIRADGYTYHGGYKTTTQNVVARFFVDDERTVIFKFLNNDMESQVPSRLSRAEMDADPRSAGVTSVTGIAGGVSAQRAAQNRQDRRTVVGARYEQQLTPMTSWRFLGEYDVKDINQTFGTISDNVNPNFHQYADLTHEGELLGLPAAHSAGVYFDRMEQEASAYRNLADGEGTRGALQSNTRGFHQNLGVRAREEAELAPRWTAVAGAAVERSHVKAAVQTRTAAETYSRVDADRLFYNAAPEAAVLYKSDSWTGRARTAMGYGTPGISQLTTAPSGLAGNNTGLRPQRNLGFELGAGGTGALSWDAAAYYEVFWNEFVTQSPGAGLLSYTSNAPRADHRGVELWADWRHPSGWLLAGAWTFNDHVYRTFRESIGGGVSVDRAGSRVPGVERSILNLRAGWERPDLPGGWLEWNRVEGYPVNNANTLRARTSNVLNLNAHWKRKVAWGPVDRVTLTFDARNLMNVAYDGSAVTVSDASTDTPAALMTKQAFFAGQGRSAYGGVTLHF